MKLSAGTLFLILCALACVDRINVNDHGYTPSANDIVFTDIVANGASTLKECRGCSDWVELTNQANQDISLVEGRWFLTDDYSVPEQFIMPATVIERGMSLYIWCDGDLFADEGIHANFRLNNKGETVWLFYKNTKGRLIEISSISF